MTAVSMQAVVPRLFVCLLCVCAASSARAEAAATATREDAVNRNGARYSLSAHGETHAALFQRALLPGTYGAVIADETLLPVYQYAQLSARDLNIASKGSGLDLELSAWCRGELATSSNERGADGDVQAANLGYHQGPFAARFGRQHPRR